MEDTLREITKRLLLNLGSLNPCFNGRYSQRLPFLSKFLGLPSVLILVLMEDTLRVEDPKT